MASSSYLNLFKRKVVWSQDLNNPRVLDEYALRGYLWMRRADPKQFSRIVRYPTVGFYVEVFTSKHPGTLHIDSPKAKHLLGRACYFTHDIRWSS